MATEREIEAAMAVFAETSDELEGSEPARALRLSWTAALAAAEQVRASEWQPIETAPFPQIVEGDDLRVWVIGGRYDKPTLIEADGDWWRSLRRGHTNLAPTHWQHIAVPLPPKATA